ncbi:MAG: hypothetical protein IKA07_02825 [Alistipes sp.]|nr:hypothetical protein [Alistipes sp.]
MKRAFTSLCICAALSFAGCIDRSFDLAETSGEITVGGEELVVPLGEISKITLNDLIGENETLKPNEEGVYQISYSSFGDDPTKYENISIDGLSIPNITGLSPKLDPISFSMESLPTSLHFRAINQKFDVEFPSINEIMKIVPIKGEQGIDIAFPSILPKQGVIDDRMLQTLSFANATAISATDSWSTTFQAEITLLKELKQVDWVEFGSAEHPNGSPFELVVDLQGLKEINGGGTLDVEVIFPKGYYLRDENGVDFPQATHNIYTKSLQIAPKQKQIIILMYLNKIDYSDEIFTEGLLEINDTISYSYKLNMEIGKGSYNLNSMPKISFEAAPEYKDVEIVINHFELPTIEHNLSYSFNGMPNGISIDKVAFTEDTNLVISLKGLEWCVVKDNITGDDISPKLELDLPLCMRFRDHALLDEQTNVLLATTEELAQGVTLSLEAIDCKGDNVKLENGQLLINEKIAAAIHMESIDGHTILLSEITPPADFAISVGIAETQLKLDIANTKVTWSEDQSFDFNLGSNVPSISQTIEIPDIISSIKSIEIGKANSDKPLSMRFSLATGNTFPVDELEINLAVNLGKLLRPTAKMLTENIITKSDNGDYILAINESWQPKRGAFTKVLEFEAIENIPAIKDGKLTLNQSFPVTGSAKIKSGESIDLSAVSDAQVNIDIAIDDIEVRTFTGVLDIAVKPEQMVVELGDLGDIDKLGLDINALSLNPVLSLGLKDNPVGLGFDASVLIKTYDKEGKELVSISVPTISIASSGASNIVISTPRNRTKYEKEGVSFIAIEDLSKLLSNGIPAKITADLAVEADNKEITLDIKRASQGYNIEYQYEMLLPFEFDGDLDLSAQTSITGLNDVFASLAEETTMFKVGDVGIIAEFGTTIPFDIIISAELINAEGTTEGIAAKLNINNCVLKGYNPATDGEKSISRIDLDFDLGESGKLDGLRNADGIRFKLAIYNSDNEVATLNKDHFVDGKLKLRVRDGLTIDIFDSLSSNKEE